MPEGPPVGLEGARGVRTEADLKRDGRTLPHQYSQSVTTTPSVTNYERNKFGLKHVMEHVIRMPLKCHNFIPKLLRNEFVTLVSLRVPPGTCPTCFGTLQLADLLKTGILLPLLVGESAPVIEEFLSFEAECPPSMEEGEELSLPLLATTLLLLLLLQMARLGTEKRSLRLLLLLLLSRSPIRARERGALKKKFDKSFHRRRDRKLGGHGVVVTFLACSGCSGRRGDRDLGRHDGEKMN